MTWIRDTLEKWDWATADDVDFVSEEAEKKFATRKKRLVTALENKKPDRVPFAPEAAGNYQFHYTDTTHGEALDDYDKLVESFVTTVTDFDWDIHPRPTAFPKHVFQAVGYKPLLFPGEELKDEAVTYQFVEPGQEVKGVQYPEMDPEEYEDLARDPTDFNLRSYLPTVCEALEPFENMNPIGAISGYYSGFLDKLGAPGMEEAFEALAEASRETKRYSKATGEAIARTEAAGYPPWTGANVDAPLDVIGDNRRGTEGVLTDMYRRPEELKKACDALVPYLIEHGVRSAKYSQNPFVTFRLHKGIFMSPEQYEEFYWPSLKKTVEGLIENDCIPHLYAEGDYRPYLDIIGESPEEKVIIHIEDGIYEANEQLADDYCLTGGIDTSLLEVGSTEEVREATRKAVEVLGEDGGFVLQPSAPMDTAKPENLRAIEQVLKQR